MADLVKGTAQVGALAGCHTGVVGPTRSDEADLMARAVGAQRVAAGLVANAAERVGHARVAGRILLAGDECAAGGLEERLLAGEPVAVPQVAAVVGDRRE